MSDVAGADIIVVGAGSAGAVVARRMVDAGAAVLLVEAGGPDVNRLLHEPHNVMALKGNAEDWCYQTVPQAHAAGRRLSWPRGKVLGGSSTVNGMMWVRGAPADFDHWAYLGNAGWSYEDLLPLFRRIEDFDRGPSAEHGVGGPVHISTAWEPDAIHSSFVDAAVEAGIPFTADHNGRDVLGAGFTQFNIRDGVRESTSVSYLRPVADAPNLEVVTFAHAQRLIFSASRCVGVEWVRDGRPERAHAAAEVVVCAGVVGSPQLLMLSGVGPATELAAHGITVLADLPGVGGNLHDHVHAPVAFSTARPVEGPGIGLSPMQSHVLWRTDPRLPVPDVQLICMGGVAYSEPPYGFTVNALVARPVSRGRLRLASDDPDDPPLIDPAVLADGADLKKLAAGIRLLREIGACKALAEWGAQERAPGPSAQDDAALAEYIRATADGCFHPVGTCRMGIDEDAVVDAELRVHGIDGLRVADASIMPTVPSTNTNAGSLVIGERAADLLGGAPYGAGARAASAESWSAGSDGPALRAGSSPAVGPLERAPEG